MLKIKIKNMFQNIRHWLSFVFKFKHINLIKEACISYPYDFDNYFRLERAKLVQMLEYFQISDIVETSKIVRDLKVCINLLDIILGNTTVIDASATGIMWPKDGEKFYNRDINTNNMFRFISIKHESYYMDNLDEYYIEKAKHLYFEILKNRIFTWWD